ncbi:MAG: sulfatase-like hydrolase/transferase [Alphaproteobacteria bacterium]|nr:sulfatase-like hydrolase/transferase [Alphaproteobacteria bacterium]MCB9697429.1 sulfatase-like hydrolase/transferase [Alphaproteobacteria bacterium]
MWLLPLLLTACKPPSEVPIVTPTDGHTHTDTGTSTRSWTGPNILLVMVDDVGVDKVAAYHEVDADLRTPTIDALAAEGTMFTNAWGSPVCSPARGAFMTGRHARRTGLGTNWNYETQLEGEYEFPLEEVTIAEVVAASPDGWSSAFLGKWHLTTVGDRSADHPIRQGWQSFSGILENLQVPPPGSEEPGSYYHWKRWDGDGTIAADDRYATTAVVDDAIASLGRMSEPWLLEVSFEACHFPLDLPPQELTTYLPSTSNADAPAVTRAMIEAMDTELARLLDAIPADARARTTVVFVGDNGTATFAAEDPGGAQVGKGSLFDVGVRVPFIVAGPLVAHPGSVSDALVSLVDVLPTVADLAGVDLASFESPRHPGSPLTIDGRSLRPLLEDPSASIHDTVWTEKFGPLEVEPLNYDWRAIRDPRFKLIREVSSGTVQFYDYAARTDEVLREGPELLRSEIPLSAEHQAAYDRLSAEMDAQMAAMMDDLPLP